MDILILILLVLLGWPVALGLAIKLSRARQRLEQITKESHFRRDAEPERERSASRQLADLILLRLELKRLLGSGAIDEAKYEGIIKQIDALWCERLEGWGARPENDRWRVQREQAWALLERNASLPIGPPPWRATETPAPQLELDWKHQPQPEQVTESEESAASITAAASAVTGSEQTAAVLTPVISVPLLIRPVVKVPETAAREQPAEGRVPTESVPLIGPAEAVLPLEDTSSAATRVSLFPPSPPATAPDAKPLSAATEGYAWSPAEAGPLERALQVMSGWHALVTPFLVHNIGWFIGGFCFVAGSIFLVSYTTGYAKVLTIFCTMFAYTLLLLWGGYQLCRRRPDLKTSSFVLLTLGVLLVPLTIAAATRLIITAQESASLLLIAILVSAIGLGVFYLAVTVASGVMYRSLQGRHPQILLALAAAQLATPLLGYLLHWSWLALAHLVLLGLLAWGLVLFAKDWLHFLFIEQRKIAYYAAGTLVYAALVSFVHLTWGAGEALLLPGGYYGPFLMALCGLLFYVDAQFKQWTRQYVFLSHFNFVLYGLSVLALALVFDEPGTRIITLVLAIGLYAVVVWNYLTLPPLYLLLACLVWLYGLLILRHLPASLHLLSSLPGLFGLYAISRWALSRRSASLSLIGYRVLVALLVTLTGWSLLHGRPSLTSLCTALIATGLAYSVLKSAPATLFTRIPDGLRADELNKHVDLRNGPWFYSVTLAAAVTLAYAPLWTGLDWGSQSALGLVILATLWTWLGLTLVYNAQDTGAAKIEVFINSALLGLIVALFLTLGWPAPDTIQPWSQPLLLALAGGILLCLSLGLYVRWLLYGVLLLWGTAGVLIKLRYFPAPSPGFMPMLLALVVWIFMWWLERAPGDIATLQREQAELRAARFPSLTLLWCFPASLKQKDASHV
jgi:hypothetical protein